MNQSAAEWHQQNRHFYDHNISRMLEAYAADAVAQAVKERDEESIKELDELGDELTQALAKANRQAEEIARLRAEIDRLRRPGCHPSVPGMFD